MIKCPHCNQEVDHLVTYESYEQCSHVSLDEEHEGQLRYAVVDSAIPMEDGLQKYECPRCQGLIATSHKEAMAFLAGE